jgi:hypothetical protein
MGMFSFEVGKKEIHTVTFELSRLSWGHRVSIDGSPIKKGMQFFIGSREAVFDVGEREKHRVRINWHIPYAGVFRTFEVQVFIDGKLYNTYKL